jgi:hypothetical protein
VSSWAYEDQFSIYDLSLLIIGERVQILDGGVSFGGHIGVPSDNNIAWAISENKESVAIVTTQFDSPSRLRYTTNEY